MIDYIKKIISPDCEMYQIKYQGKVRRFRTNEDLKAFLDYVEKNINTNIRDNSHQIAKIEISERDDKNKKFNTKLRIIFQTVAALITCAGVATLAFVLKEVMVSLLVLAPLTGIAVYSTLDDKLKQILENPEILRLRDENKDLSEQLELVKSLRRHLLSLEKGIKIDKDIFSEEYFSKRVSLKDRLRLAFGFEPKTSNEFTIFKAKKGKEIKRLTAEEKKIGVKKESFPEDVKCSSLRISSGVIRNIYASRLRELSKRNVILNREVKQKEMALSYERSMLECQITRLAIRMMDLYPDKTLDEVKEIIRSDKMPNSKPYTRASNAYNIALARQVSAEAELKSFHEKKAKRRFEIICELLKYKKLLTREHQISLKKLKLSHEMESYSRVYK